ncbi:hypothetical protein CYMTET_19384, partial [Cymbomonas tetramitiformis]
RSLWTALLCLIRAQVVVESPYEAAPKSAVFDALPNHPYFIVICTSDPAAAVGGKLRVTSIVVNDYILERVDTIQDRVMNALYKLEVPNYEVLPELVREAGALDAVFAGQAMMSAARMVGTMESMRVANNEAGLRAAIETARRSAGESIKLHMLVHFNLQRRNMMVERLLDQALNPPGRKPWHLGGEPLYDSLLASIDASHILKYQSDNVTRSKKAIAMAGLKVATVSGMFKCEEAAGCHGLHEEDGPHPGLWRENPAYLLTTAEGSTSGSTMLCLSINDGGEILEEEGEESFMQWKAAELEARIATAQAWVQKCSKKAGKKAAKLEEDPARALAKAEANLQELVAQQDARKQREAEYEALVAAGGPIDHFDKVGVHLVCNTWGGVAKELFAGVQMDHEVKAFSGYKKDTSFLLTEVDLRKGPYFIVPSAFTRGLEGPFTLSAMMVGANVQLERVPSFKHQRYPLLGEWRKDLKKPKGPRELKPAVGKDAKNVVPEKSWNLNPQYRVWLAENGSAHVHKKVTTTLRIVLQTEVPRARLGLHVMRNLPHPKFDSKVEVLEAKFQVVVAKTPVYDTPGEVYVDVKLSTTSGKKEGCSSDSPFFIVPSLDDKKASGRFTMIVYSDKPLVIEPLEEGERNLKIDVR